MERTRPGQKIFAPMKRGFESEALGQLLDPQQPARGDGRRAIFLHRPREENRRRGSQGREIMRRQTNPTLRGLKSEILAHRPRQPGIGRGFRGPLSFIQAGKNDEVEIQQSRFQRSQNGKPRMKIVARPHGTRFGELAVSVGVIAGRGECDTGAVADELLQQIGRRFTGRSTP